MFKVIIAGSRDFNDYGLLKRTLDYVLQNKVAEGIVIVSGAARGADKLGEKYAEEREYTIESYPADWGTHGKSAGYIRNEEMAKVSDALVAFWDGKSHGTNHMINLAHKHGLKVVVVRYGDEAVNK